MIFSAVLNLATVRTFLPTFPVLADVGELQIAISVSIERDWVTVIAQGSSKKLTRLNTFVPDPFTFRFSLTRRWRYLRRIDLITKLVAPLFVSLLTTVVSYPFSVAFMLGFGRASATRSTILALGELTTARSGLHDL